MGTTERQMSLRKKANDAMSRLDSVESQVDDLRATQNQLVMGVNRALSKVDQDNQQAREMLDAVIQLMGPEEVTRVLAENRLARMVAEAEQTKAAIAKALESGDLVKADKISENTLVVGRDLKADGSEAPPGYTALPMPRIDKPFQDKLLGQTVGFSVDTKDGCKFEVRELYNPVEKKPVVAPDPGPTPEEGDPTAASPTEQVSPAAAVEPVVEKA